MILLSTYSRLQGLLHYSFRIVDESSKKCTTSLKDHELLKVVPNILEVQENEKIAAMICVKGFNERNESIVLATKNGVVKKDKLSDFRNFEREALLESILMKMMT